MKRPDLLWISVLAVTGVWLWTREINHASLAAADSLPLLLAFPLFWKLGSPWNFRQETTPLPAGRLTAALAVGTAGAMAGLAFLTALGWTMALGIWLWTRIIPTDRARLIRLLVLPLLGFPWLIGAGGLGWYFRLSGACMAEQCFAASGFDLVRNGSLLLVEGEPISVEAACAGLGSLQAMLLAGAAAAAIEWGRSPRFWWCLPCLFAAAWLANTVRVLVLAAAALSAGHEFASGTFHGVAGWLILTLTFAGCLAFFRSWAAPAVRRTFIPQPASR